MKVTDVKILTNIQFVRKQSTAKIFTSVTFMFCFILLKI